jgi:fructose-1,6-bisphosphatase/inositol monophosphatase family enzyme
MRDELADVMSCVGAKLLQWRESHGTEGAWVGGGQYKARADQWAHEVLETELNQRWPGLHILSEESADSWFTERPEQYFIIDPIDGTRSYVDGYSGFVTQAAFIVHSVPVIGVVYAPVLRLCYTAELGAGAYRNGERVRVNSTNHGRVLIDNYPEPSGFTKNIYDAFGFEGYVECGSIGLKICKIADGTADTFVKDVPVRDWDVAAPQVVLGEAGGHLTTLDGSTIAYSGAVEHHGLIASASAEMAERVVRWYGNL